MTSIEFTVHSVPVAQPRQRHRIINAHGKIFSANYTPAKDPVQQYKFEIKQIAGALFDREPLWTGPLGMRVETYLPRPKKFDSKKYPSTRIAHAGKKDVDNLFKSVADALTGVIYRDDGQICFAQVRKWYHARDDSPHVDVLLWKEE